MQKPKRVPPLLLSLLALLAVFAGAFNPSTASARVDDTAPAASAVTCSTPLPEAELNITSSVSKAGLSTPADVSSAAFCADGTVISDSPVSNRSAIAEALPAYFSQGRFGNGVICVEDSTPYGNAVELAETGWDDRSNDVLMNVTGHGGCVTTGYPQKIPVGTYSQSGGACAVAYKYGVEDDINDRTSMYVNTHSSVQATCYAENHLRRVKVIARAMGYIIGLADDGDIRAVMTYGNWDVTVPSRKVDLCRMEVRLPWYGYPNCSAPAKIVGVFRQQDVRLAA